MNPILLFETVGSRWAMSGQAFCIDPMLWRGNHFHAQNNSYEEIMMLSLGKSVLLAATMGGLTIGCNQRSSGGSAVKSESSQFEQFIRVKLNGADAVTFFDLLQKVAIGFKSGRSGSVSVDRIMCSPSAEFGANCAVSALMPHKNKSEEEMKAAHEELAKYIAAVLTRYRLPTDDGLEILDTYANWGRSDLNDPAVYTGSMLLRTGKRN